MGYLGLATSRNLQFCYGQVYLIYLIIATVRAIALVPSRIPPVLRSCPSLYQSSAKE